MFPWSTVLVDFPSQQRLGLWVPAFAGTTPGMVLAMTSHDASFSTTPAVSSPFSSSRLRARGSMPSAQTVTIWTTSSPAVAR